MDTCLDLCAVVCDFLSNFEGFLVGRGLARRTVEGYLQDVRRFMVWYEVECGYALGGVQDVTGVDLRAWREFSLGVERVSPATWNRRRSSMRVFVGWGQEAGLVVYDPFVGVEKAEEVEQGPRWLEAGELRKVLRVCERRVLGAKSEGGRRRALRDQVMIFLMVYAGLREGEVVGLDLGDVVVGERSGKVVVRRGKGDKRREVPLGVEVRRVLSVFLEVQGVNGPCGSLPMFTGTGSERLTTRTVQRVVKELGRLAGVDVTPHQLRHTFAKRVLDQGGSLTVVQRLLGHARLETTARYVRPGWGDLERAVEVI